MNLQDRFNDLIESWGVVSVLSIRQRDDEKVAIIISCTVIDTRKPIDLYIFIEKEEDLQV